VRPQAEGKEVDKRNKRKDGDFAQQPIWYDFLHDSIPENRFWNPHSSALALMRSPKLSTLEE
jgi:hypothetical protein